jgi:putative peptidoglycan lipid II flippase
MQDSRTPALINIGAAFVMMGIDIALVRSIGWDVPALALGHAASYAFATLVGLIVLRPRLGSLDGARIWGTIVRVIPAAAATGAVAWLVAAGVADLVDTQAVIGRVLQVGAATVVGLGVYLAAALMLRIEEVEEVRGAIRRRFRG